MKAKPVFKKTCFQENLFSRKPVFKKVFKKPCFQENLFSRKPVFKKTSFQENMFSRNTVFKWLKATQMLIAKKLLKILKHSGWTYFMKNCFPVVKGKKLLKILNPVVENKKVEKNNFSGKTVFKWLKATQRFIKKSCWKILNPAVERKFLSWKTVFKWLKATQWLKAKNLQNNLKPSGWKQKGC